MKQKCNIWVTLLILLVCVGCSKKDENLAPDGMKSTQTAEFISHATFGTISPDDSIIIKFVNAVIDKEEIGAMVDGEIFHFTPGIEGSATWKDCRTIEFKPDSKLPAHNNYKGFIFYNQLFPQYNNLKPLQIYFSVIGRAILSYKADFELIEKNDPENVRYEGTLSFTQSIRLDKVKKAVSFYIDKQEIPLQWQVLKKNVRFSFSSSQIERTNNTKNFILKIDKKVAELALNYSKNITLSPLKSLEITNFIKRDQSDTPSIEIFFSDQLDPRQDVTGLIQVEKKSNSSTSKQLKTDIKKQEKSILLEGDFVYGQSYFVKVSGIRSKWGNKLKGEVARWFDFKDRKPQISFLQAGTFLPSANQRKIGFKTMNIKNLQVEVKKVFESNLGQFLHTEKISSQKNRNRSFNHSYVNRVGVVVAEKKLHIGDIKNKWLTHQLDMSKLIKPGEKGLFLVNIFFEWEDMLYADLKGKPDDYYYGNDYYSNPNSRGYLLRHASIFKPIVVSDIGLTYKIGGDNHYVFVSDIITATPMKDVKITLRSYQNQKIAEKLSSGKQGVAVFENIKQQVFYIEAEKDNQRSFIVPAEMAWNISSFDTGGEAFFPDQTRAFIYTERGVYRPGDQMNISVIARNKDNTFPDNHPVTLKIYNPKNQLIFNKTNTEGKEGFYNFPFKTKPEDLTGNWRAQCLVGSRIFNHTLKIETVAPYRLKINIEPENESLTPTDQSLQFLVKSNYLFGTPAANLRSKVDISLKHRSKSFPAYHGFYFDNESLNFSTIQKSIYDDNLDEKGVVKLQWDLPLLNSAPSAISAHISARVYEKGGRATLNTMVIPVDPYEFYIGIQRSSSCIRLGSTLEVPIIVVDGNGIPLAKKSLKYKIYKNNRYWWWEYDSIKNFRVRFKNDSYTRKIKEEIVVSNNAPVTIEFKPEDRGEYLMEVESANEDGHKAGFFFSVNTYRGAYGDLKDVGTLTLAMDKQIYYPGDMANITFPRPNTGTALVTVEKENRILHSQIYQWKSKKEFKETDEETNTQIQIPVTHEMLPNVYVTVSIIQPHQQTKNDRPLRMYGLIPLMVKDPSTVQDIELIMGDRIKSNEEFQVTVQTRDKQPTQLTVAVVDEGLLDITHFLTPDPWKHFFKKQKLSISTFDLFSFVIGAHKGDIFRLFSIGGDMDSQESYRSSQTSEGKVQRFKPVCMFKGPITTDEKGKAKVTFKMPNYIGSVRVMVVSAKNNRYGKAVKTVPVKTDLMILPTLPRVLGPGDKFEVPVSVFSMEKEISDVSVTIDVKGPVKIVGEKQHSLEFQAEGEKNVKFLLQVDLAVGPASITIKAESGNKIALKKTDINIRAASPRFYQSANFSCEPGKTIEVDIPNEGIAGSQKAMISVMRKKKMNLNHRLQWLIRYPYGCIEQTTSSVFPQLYLKSFLKSSDSMSGDIDGNINAGIQRLRRFQTPSGGFAYWPGGRSPSIWGTNYGGHFLIEAKKRGYHVPEGMFQELIRFLKSRAFTEKDNLIKQTYRLYILALAGFPEIGPMNLLKENKLHVMNNPEKWMLAAAYYLSGRKETARNILEKAGLDVKDYSELGGTYGSTLRDKAIILEAATILSDWNQADSLFDEIIELISSDYWYSTQTTGYCLLAAGKYIQMNEMDQRWEKSVLSGYFLLPNGEKVSFETDQITYSLPIKEGFGKKCKVFIHQSSTLKRAFITLEWSGVPMNPEVTNISKNLNVEVQWLDNEGDFIDPSSIKQGTIFWGHFKVRGTMCSYRTIDELALVQIIPAGWEIENTRLIKGNMPEWLSNWKLAVPEYLDIRDDRVMWFFDMRDDLEYHHFVVKLNAVTVGEFTLPPTLFEAMYNDKYKSIKKGGKVAVTPDKRMEEEKN